MNIPRLAAIRQRSATTEPTGSILLLVLVVVAALALGTGTYLQLMQTELRAVRYHGRGAQATRLAESAVEYLKVVLALPPAEVQLQGGLAANPTTMQAQLADDQPSDFDRGRFTVLAPAQADGRYAGVRFGLEDEAAKLNLNVLLAEGAEDQAQFRLLALPGMTPQIADAILDWLDPDDAPRPFGAERESYAQFDPPYEPRNGPIASLDELLLVRGVTPELLYGLDQNRNFFVDAGETARGVLTQIDNTEGLLNRGWSSYLTLNSVEAMAAALGGPVDVNGPDLQSLYNSLKTSLDDGEAKFIILYRQYGASNNNQQAGGEAGPRGRGAANQQNNQRSAERNGNSPAGNARNQGASVSAGSIELNFQQQGGAQINSLLDLVGAQVSVPSESQQSQNQNQNAGQNQENNDAPNNGPNQNRNQNQGPPQIVDSPWQDDAATHRDLLKLYDVARAGQADRIAGRVNVNQAPRVVLRSIPGMTAAVINQIVAVRELEPDRVLSEQRHVIWPLVQGFVTLDEMRQLERYITTRGDAFSGQVVGFFDAGRTSARGEFVLDRSGTQPRLRLWRDLSSWGPGFSPQLLGAQPVSSQLQ
jgi:DNA uptake protein ComE-like DNA-binding protein